MTNDGWRKSSRSGRQGACVEVKALPESAQQ
ncbi:DUF397 domain-containing protein [Actinoallomurus rhizosphaericola]|nr:DUF397 domain-containing protein [Actinoallomurus rhizosphaericola]MCO5997506.1 DUF397 domain-containing protein [Actinoallomurus rhizosphaericola]